MAEGKYSSDSSQIQVQNDADDPDTTNNDNAVNNNVSRKFYINNLSGKVNKQNLQTIFSMYGKIESCNLSRKNRNRSIVSANVTFVFAKDALKAQEAANKKEILYNGKILTVVPALSTNERNKNHDNRRKGPGKRRNLKKQKNAHESQDGSNNLDFVNKLDDDCLIHIFLKLSFTDRIQVEQVCKRWQDVSARSWHDVKELNLSRSMLEHNPQINLRLINNRAVEKMLIRCGRFLTCLTLSTYDLGCNTDILIVVAEHCHNLDKLTLQLKKYTTKPLQKLFSQTKKLRYLEMEELDRTFTDECLDSLSALTLKELHLSAKITNENFSSCYKHLSRFAPAIFRKLKNLNSLALNGFLLKPEKIKAICSSGNLSSLSLKNCAVRKYIHKIGNLHNLQYLNLSKVSEVSDSLLVALASECPQLTYLNISHCTSVTNYGISALANLQNLKTLYINEIYDVHDDNLGDLIYLETLHCENCELIGDPGICSLILTAPNLQFLNLFNCSVSPEVLDTADLVTKRRTNNLKLRLIVNSSLTEIWDSEERCLSELLDIETKDDDSIWEDIWDTDDDIGNEDGDDFLDDEDDEYDEMGFYGFDMDNIWDSDYDYDNIFDYIAGHNHFL